MLWTYWFFPAKQQLDWAWPPGWGPRNISYGLQIAKEVMAAVNVTSLEELRKVPAEKAGNRWDGWLIFRLELWKVWKEQYHCEWSISTKNLSQTLLKHDQWDIRVTCVGAVACLYNVSWLNQAIRLLAQINRFRLRSCTDTYWYICNCMYKYIYRYTCMHIRIWIKRPPRGGLWEVIVRFAALCQEWSSCGSILFRLLWGPFARHSNQQ